MKRTTDRVNLILTAGLVGFALWAWPRLPDKTRLADLPEVARKPVVGMASGFLALIQAEILVIFALIQLGIYRTAMGEENRAIMILVLLIAILTSPFLLVVFFLRLQSALAKGKELAAAGADPVG